MRTDRQPPSQAIRASLAVILLVSAGAALAAESPKRPQHSSTAQPATRGADVAAEHGSSAPGALLNAICKDFPCGENILPDRFSSHPAVRALTRLAETDVDSLLAEGHLGESLMVINPQTFEQFKDTKRMSLRGTEEGSIAADAPTWADYEKYLADWKRQDDHRRGLEHRRSVIWMVVKTAASDDRQVLIDLLDHENLSVRWSTTRFLLANPSLKDEKVAAALRSLARDKPPAVPAGSATSPEQARRRELPGLAARVLSKWQVRAEVGNTPDSDTTGGTLPGDGKSTILRRGDLIGRHISALRKYGDGTPLLELETPSRVPGITERGTEVGMWKVGDGILVVETSLGAGFVADISYVIVTGKENEKTTLKVKEFNLTKGEMVIIVPGCAKSTDSPPSHRDETTPATARHGPGIVVLSGEHELDVEVVSFRATNNRRQSWVFGFHKLTDPEAFTLELRDNDSFATSFIKENPEFMKEYWEERRVIGEKEKMWDYTKPVNPYQRFHIKVDARPSGARILEWKLIE